MKDKPIEVIVMGTIHNQHLSSKKYGLKEVKAIIEAINPDVVLAEMPPDRFAIASKQFDETGEILEPRILQYPEFSKVIFPLSKTMNFELKPVSAWTEAMANERDVKLEDIKYNPARSKDWETYNLSREKSSKLFNEKIKEFTPENIHTQEFDDILSIELSVFDKLFNNDLGKGGWTNINNSHYKLIDTELNKIKGSVKRVLIIFGAGHKGWLNNKLKERSNINLINLIDAL